METVKVCTKNGYDVVIGSGEANKKAFESFGDARLFLLTDENVINLYGDMFDGFCCFAAKYVIPAGEKSKTYEKAAEILQAMIKSNLNRNDILVALGGGVVGDLGGFCASIYMRGIRYIQVPTTLLAAVDSSVGGKTAVDFSGNKNSVGTFWQPSKVICDTEFLSTLTERQYAAGMAEIIKYGAACDGEFFDKLESGSFNTEEIISRCVKIKSNIVAQDTYDTGLRKILNFGHTVGHSVEKLSNYTYLHGEAVSIGMSIILRGCKNQGLTDGFVCDRVINLLKKNSLPVECDFSAENILESTLHDKKRRGNITDIIVLKDIGNARILSVDGKFLGELIKSGI